MTFKCGFFYLIWKLCIHRPSQAFNWFTEFDFLISCWIFEYSSRGIFSCITGEQFLTQKIVILICQCEIQESHTYKPVEIQSIANQTSSCFVVLKMVNKNFIFPEVCWLSTMILCKILVLHIEQAAGWIFTRIYISRSKIVIVWILKCPSVAAWSVRTTSHQSLQIEYARFRIEKSCLNGWYLVIQCKR